MQIPKITWCYSSGTAISIDLVDLVAVVANDDDDDYVWHELEELLQLPQVIAFEFMAMTFDDNSLGWGYLIDRFTVLLLRVPVWHVNKPKVIFDLMKTIFGIRWGHHRHYSVS